uniref:Uncharacterized protein n=1 Tax=Ditylum brightwellii TaxID=49249 RepID=A0A7S4SN45_9STRA|mmetsp:Transcript_3548/g.4813  ORF Transcript_3548/g.4813 Transcript_3548/m.4813 type:complete len:169 (+) Transcript_3548:126-632(+)
MSLQFLFRFIIVAAMIAIPVEGFSIPTYAQRHGRVAAFSSQTTLLYSSSKEDEIAALEEKLRLLKEEAAQQQQEEEGASEIEAEIANLRNADEPYVEMLSEQWKESDVDNESSGGLLTTVLGVAIALVFLIGFSQIPVGQEDYSRYSVTPGVGSTKIDLGDLNPAKGD